MRTIPTAEARLVTARQRWVALRVTLSSNRNGSAWSVELTNHVGRNWVKSAEWTEDLDAATGSATIRLTREVYSLSLSPMRTGSKLNAQVQLLRALREVKIETQLVALGASANPSGTWTNAFEGYVASIDFGGDDEITLTCRDRAGLLQDTWIEHEQPPLNGATNWYTALTWSRSLEAVLQDAIDSTLMDDSTSAWQASHAYAVGNIRRPTTRNGYAYKVTGVVIDSLTGGSEPTWPTVIGSTVTDNHVTWTCTTELPELYTPTASGFAINDPAATGNQLWRKESLLEVLRRLAAMRGWDVKYRWHDGTSAWRLTLFDPRRGAGTDLELDASQYAVASARLDIAGVRNVVGVQYAGTAGALAVETATDDTSIGDYGRRYCDLTEEAASQIDTSTEAGDLASTILGDLSSPWALVGVELPLHPYLQISDVVSLGGGHRYWDADLAVVVTSLTHSVGNDGKATTRLKGRETDGTVRAALQQVWVLGETRFLTGVAPAMPGLVANTLLGAAVRVEAYQTSDETFTSLSGSNPCPINFDAKKTDTLGTFTLASSSAPDAATASRFTAPATGFYSIAVSIALHDINAVAAQGPIRFYLLKNGTTEIGSVVLSPGPDVTTNPVVNLGTGIGLAAGDYVTAHQLFLGDEGTPGVTRSGVGLTTFLAFRLI